MKRWFRPRPPRRPPTPPPGESPARPARSLDWRSTDAIAERYEELAGPRAERIAEDVLRLAHAAEGSRVLDVGTATGRAVQVASTTVGPAGLAVGIDKAHGMLAVGSSRNGTLPLVAADVVDLPFQDHSFDVVMASLALGQFVKYDTALHEMMRVLRPDGRIAIAAWLGEDDELTKTWRTMVEQTVGRESLRGAVQAGEPWVHVTGKPNKLEGILRDAGLRPVDVTKTKYRFAMSREDYIRAREIEPLGRFAKTMLGERFWASLQERVRVTFAERFDDEIIDFRDALIAVGTKPT